ncbi:unnamed protein product, partial [Didymodactylos carnosus]
MLAYQQQQQQQQQKQTYSYSTMFTQPLPPLPIVTQPTTPSVQPPSDDKQQLLTDKINGDKDVVQVKWSSNKQRSNDTSVVRKRPFSRSRSRSTSPPVPHRKQTNDRYYSNKRSRFDNKSPLFYDRTTLNAREEYKDSERSKNEKNFVPPFDAVPRRKRQNEFIEDEYNDSNSDNDDNKSQETKNVYVRTCSSEIYYRRDEQNPRIIHATQRLKELCERFKKDVLSQREQFRCESKVFEEKNYWQILHKLKNFGTKKCRCDSHDSSDSCCDESQDDDEENEKQSDDDGENLLTIEIERKKQVPHRLHPDLWFNEYKQGNDGPAIPLCNSWTNNADRLYHYRITLTPDTNFILKEPTLITYDDHDYTFEGFSVLSHVSLANVNDCIVVYHNIDYAIGIEEEKCVEHYTISELDLLQQYIFIDLIELYDIQWKLPNVDLTSTCSCFHFFPRFSRQLPQNGGKELLNAAEMLLYFLKHLKPLVPKELNERCATMSVDAWEKYVSKIQGSIISFPTKRPSCVRLDQLDREPLVKNESTYPLIVHFGMRPAILSIQYNQEYRQAYKAYLKVFFLLKNRKPTDDDKQNLRDKELKLKQIILKNSEQLKRETVVVISSENAYRTGIKSDLIQYGLLISSLHDHLRFHISLKCLEDNLIQYQFKNRSLMQLALTHPSGNYVLHNNLGPNPDHVKNTLANCRVRNTMYGDRKQLFRPITKRGVSTLFKIMAKKAKNFEHISEITNYERLEFLGDALLEFLVSIHLFFLFPQFDEGRMSTFRVGLIQNHFFTILARNLQLEHFIIYNHGPDLCSHSALNHALANSFEALMGAIYLDGGLYIVDKILSKILFFNDQNLTDIWNTFNPYPLKIQYPDSDRHLIEKVPLLKKLTKFEQETGIEFQHIRMLAQAFCTRPIPQNDLTIEDNERLEFLGDTVLNFVVSDYLYRHFPEHHEGHLSLLRSCTVSNPTQAIMYDELGMQQYVDCVREQLRITTPKIVEKSLKAKADVFEAFIAALFIDQGLEAIYSFCRATIFPRLQEFISTQYWNDPKSNLQHCCLALRDPNDRNPPLPEYRVLKSIGSSNNVQYKVGVYFRKQRLAIGNGRSIHDAEMASAKNALESHASMFPLLHYQKTVLEKKFVS